MPDPTPSRINDAAFARLLQLARRDEAAEELPPGVEGSATAFGRFRLVSELGRGGSSVVWRAWQPALGRWVALKILKGCNPVLRERFLLEARVTAGLSHPGILPVYEAGEHEGSLFIAMPVVHGERLDRCGLSAREAAAAVAEAARAIAAAHEAGVIHRDLKPGNLMKDASRIYVMDFGLAKILDAIEGISFHGDVLGTPAFMAPEQAFGAPVDERADVYGLGATLYALVTGRTPYAGSTAPEFTEALAAGPGGFPEGLAAVILRAMSRDPDGRHASALDFASELERVARGDWRAERPAPGAAEAPGRITTFLPAAPAAGPRLFGRDRELERLVEAGSAPLGRFVVVLGEEGAGKSALLQETSRALLGASPRRSLRAGRALEGAGAPLQAFASIVGAVSANSAAALLPRLVRDFTRASRPALESENFTHLMLLSLGFPVPGARVRHLETAVYRSETKRAWEGWLRARAAFAPVTLVVEDLDRADAGTIALLEHLASRLADAPVSILASSRFYSAIPRGFDTLALDRLRKEDAFALAREALGTDLDPDLAELLFRESRGNPAHLRELALWLRREGHVAGEPARLTSGAGNPPPDLPGLLSARFRALSAEERAVLKTGSVLGPAFRRTVLEQSLNRATGATLASLGDAGLIEMPGGPSPLGEGAIAFPDSRLRDVAYTFVPPDERRRLHELAATHLEREALAGGRRFQALAAAQWEAAGRAAEAGQAWARVARRAELDGAAEDALAAAREAARLGREDTAVLEADALLNLGRYDEILEIAGRTGLSQGRLNAFLIASSRVHRRRRAFEASLAAAVPVLAAPGNEDMRLTATAVRATALIYLGRHDEGAQAIAEGRRILDTLAETLTWQGFAQRRSGLRDLEGLSATLQGRWEDAMDTVEDSIRIDKEIGDRRRLATCFSNKAGILGRTGRMDEALATWREARNLYTETGDRHGLGVVRHNMAVVHVNRGQDAEAEREGRASMELRRDLGERWAFAVTASLVAHALRGLGRIPESRATYEEALAVLRQGHSVDDLVSALDGYSKTLLALGEAEASRAALEEAGRLRDNPGAPRGPWRVGPDYRG